MSSPPIFPWRTITAKGASRDEAILHAQDHPQHGLEAPVVSGNALLVWISVSTEPELATFVSAHVEYKNLSPGVEINSDVVETVYLEVRGPSEALRLPELPRRSAVILDMADVEPGQHTFTIDSGDVRLPRGVELLHAIPAQIRMDFEPGATRSVPVEVQFAAALPDDLQLVEATAEPSALAITGPASRVARVPSVRTDPLALKSGAGNQPIQSGRVRE